MKNSKNCKIVVFVLALVLIVSIISCFYLLYIPKKYGAHVKKYCEIFGLEQELIFAVIKAESNFKNNVVSSSGAIGLMQIMPDTAKYVLRLSSKKFENRLLDLTEPETNIEIGVRYLFYLKNRFSGLAEILAAYNAGEGRVKLWLADEKYSDNGKTLRQIPYPETEKYIKRVKKFYNYYKIFYF